MQSYSVDARAGARRAYWNQAMREVYGPCWALSPARACDFKMSMQATQIGDLTLSRASLSAAEVSTRSLLSKGAADRPYNIYIVDRRQRVVMGGQSLVLEPGDFTLADSALASIITTDEPYTTIGLTVPANFLRRYVATPDRLVGMRFSSSEGLPKAVSIMLLDMWRLAESGALAKVGARLIVSLLELFSACCELAYPRNSSEPTSASARRAQIKQVIHTHLRDPEFNVAALGREMGLSTRYLQMLFIDGDQSISQYIRRQRLERCATQLADPAFQDRSVTDIAFSWGFNSAAHFCRAFRAQYRTSPSVFRFSQGSLRAR